MTGDLLSVDGLEIRFGGLVALNAVSFSAREGAITSVIGPNGAGKTTLFNCITGMYQPHAGKVTFDRIDITAARPHRVARAGIARTFQNLALFPGLSVIDNLKVGGYRHGRSGLLEASIFWPRARREEADVEAMAWEFLEFLDLTDVADAPPSELPYGRQKQVEFGRALMQGARMILLDEPMAGMSRPEKDRMTDLLRQARSRYGVSFLLVEHDMPVVMDVSDHIVVLDYGRKIAEGCPDAIQNNSAVIDAYLGTD